MHSVSLALNKWPWTRCAPVGEDCLLCVGWGGQSRIPFGQVKLALWNKEGIRTAMTKRQRGRQELNGKEGKNLWAHSRREMGELEHFFLVDTQQRQRKKYELNGRLVFMPVFVFVTHMSDTSHWHFKQNPCPACFSTPSCSMSHFSPGEGELMYRKI